MRKTIQFDAISRTERKTGLKEYTHVNWFQSAFGQIHACKTYNLHRNFTHKCKRDNSLQFQLAANILESSHLLTRPLIFSI